MRGRRLALLVLPLILVGPSLLPGQRFLPELLSAAKPFPAPELLDAFLIHRAVQGGSLPTWAPEVGFGMPLAATSRVGAWYPPNLAYWIAEPDVARGPLALLALALAGLGLALFLERSGLSSGASLCGALALQGGAFAISNVHAGTPVDAALWLPWALWAVAALADERSQHATLAPAPARCEPSRWSSRLALFGAVALAWLTGDALVAALVTAVPAGFAIARSARAHALAWILLGVVGGAIDWIPRGESRLLLLPVERAPEEIALLAQLGGVVSLALGAVALVRATGRALFPAALVAASIALAHLADPRALALAWIGWAWLAALGAEALMALSVRRDHATAPHHRTAAASLLAVALVADGAARGAPRLQPLPVGPDGALARSELVAAIERAANGGRVVRFDPGAARGEPRSHAAPATDLLPAFGIPDLGARLERRSPLLDELLASLEPSRGAADGPLCIGDRAVLGHPVLDLLGVSAVVSGDEIAHARLALAHREPGALVYARGGALGPARVVPSVVEPGDERAELAMLSSATLALASAAIGAGGERFPRIPQTAGAFRAGELTVRRPAPHRVEARVAGSSGGWLAFHDAWYPGWKATVNGHDAVVHRVDHVCRAVSVPPGDSLVRTKFEPWSLRAGAALSALAAILALLLARRVARRSA